MCRREPSRRNYRGEKSQEAGGAVRKKGRIEKGTETDRRRYVRSEGQKLKMICERFQREKD